MEEPNLRQLRYFLAVADELHFGRAAERAGIAQPPLTQQIQKLERTLGCQLLVRGRPTSLTAAGAALAADARELLKQADQVFEAARRVGRGEAGPLRVAVPPSVMLTDLPAVIRSYRRRYPAVNFTLRELATSKIEQALRARDADLGFLRESQPAAPLKSAPYRKEELVAVLPAAHRLASAKTFALKKLRLEPFVFFPAHLGPAFHERFFHTCLDAGFSPAVVQEATQWQTIVSFVAAGMGVSLAPACVSKFRRPDVVYRLLPHLETMVYVSWRDGELSAAAGNFLKMAGVRPHGAASA
ncbi:MAG TPA: LysR substrate-binding domain-containing protein [Bryobacteraceae bacterium]|nr:LysR substrate-binding domain-containing protein [Bryobacteraceae bacterium]